MTTATVFTVDDRGEPVERTVISGNCPICGCVFGHSPACPIPTA